MEKEISRRQRNTKKPSRIRDFLYREGKRYCAVALSVCLILSNMSNAVLAAEWEDGQETVFKMTRKDLYAALQKAVKEGNTAEDEAFVFQGEKAEDYEKLLGLNDDLYELEPKVKADHKNKNFNLRIFACLDRGTDPEEAYQVYGDEEIIFLLSNHTEETQAAVIQVDEKKSEIITVAPKSSLEVSDTAAGESSSEEEKEEGTGNGAGGRGSGGAGSSGSHGSGASQGEGGAKETESLTGESELEQAGEGESPQETEGKEAEAEAAEEGSQETEERVDDKKAEDGKEESGQENLAEESGQKAEDQDKPKQEQTAESQKPEQEEDSRKPEQEEDSRKPEQEEDSRKPEKEESSQKPEQAEDSRKPDDGGQAEDKKEDESSDSSKKPESGKDNQDGSRAEDRKEPEKSDTSQNDQKESSREPEKSDGSQTDDRPESSQKTEKPDSSEKNDLSDRSQEQKKTDGSKDSGKTESSKDSGKAESSQKDEKNGQSDSRKEEGKVQASISSNRVSLVMAPLKENGQASEQQESADESETASPSDAGEKGETASPSDADHLLEGTIWDPVIWDEDAITVFVTTAKELGLDDPALVQEEETATPSQAEEAEEKDYYAEAELDEVIVQVSAEAGVLPEDAKLQVKKLDQEGEGEDAQKYEEAKEALDSQKGEYDGMMAFDISFLDQDGQEVEPDGNVQVSMKLKKEVLPENADLETIEVQHLAENEGEVSVEVVADCGSEADGSVEVKAAAHVEAEFEVESFSTFVVTWKNSSGDTVYATLDITFIEVDDAGETVGEISKDKITVNDISTEGIDLSTLVPIPAYEYVSAKCTNDCRPELKAKRIQCEEGTLYVVYENPDDPNGAGLKIGNPFSISAETKIQLELYYRKSFSQLIQIEDTVKTNGRLTVKLDKTSLGTEFADGTISYKWERNNGTDWVKVEKDKCAGSEWNLSDDGSSVNVSIDRIVGSDEADSVCYSYRVTAYVTGQDGIVTEIGTSKEYSIDYYIQLENGSFERPTVAINGYHQFLREEQPEDMVWKTTAPTGSIEIVGRNSGIAAHNLHINNIGVVDGNQCAEINGKDEGALYQDVLTVPGSVLHWELYHKARNPEGFLNLTKIHLEDTMYLVIMPTEKAEDYVFTGFQDHINELMKELEDSGYYVKKITDDDKNWYQSIGDYIVGEGQYLTRFFFVSGETMSGNRTVGNHLDKVSFGSDIPEPDPNKGHLIITKKVTGLTPEEVKDYELDLEIEGKGLSGGKIQQKLTDFRSIGNKEYVATYTLRDLDIGDYAIKETVPDEIANQLSSTYSGPNTTVEIDGKQNGSWTARVIDQKTTNVNIVNAYKQNSFELKVEKVLEDDANLYPDADITAVQFKWIPLDPHKDKLIKDFPNLFENDPERVNVPDGLLNHGIIQDLLNHTSLKAVIANPSLQNGEKSGYVLFDVSSTCSTYLLAEVTPASGFKGLTNAVIVKTTYDEATGNMTFNVICSDGDKSDVTLQSPSGQGDAPLLKVVNHAVYSAILPDTGGSGLGLIKEYGWMLLLLALMMAGMEVQYYGMHRRRHRAEE